MKFLLQQCPFATSAFTFSDIEHYYGHIRLPRTEFRTLKFIVRVSHVHALSLIITQHNFTPSSPVGFVVDKIQCLFLILSNMVTGFSISGRLTTAISVTKPYLCSLMYPLSVRFNVFVSSNVSTSASTRTTNLVGCNLHTTRYLIIYINARLVAHQRKQRRAQRIYHLFAFVNFFMFLVVNIFLLNSLIYLID